MDSATLLGALGIVFGLLGTATAGTIGYLGQRALRLQAERFELRKESEEFIGEKLDRLYLPVAMHLASTKLLIDRYFEPGTTEDEKQAIEHEIRIHNSSIRESLMLHSKYLEPDAPEALTIGLLDHLLQWDTVYRLKYDYHVYDGPVFAGISRFGFRKFPTGADDYFAKKMSELRKRQHMRSSPQAHPNDGQLERGI